MRTMNDDVGLGTAALAAVCLALAGCGEPGAPEEGGDDVAKELSRANLIPADLAEAADELTRLDSLMTRSRQDPRVGEAIRSLAGSVERLNGLVERIDIGKDHSVSFYAGADGAVSIAERAPKGAPSVVEPLLQRGPSFAQLFKGLAPGRPLPAALTSIDEEARFAATPGQSVESEAGGTAGRAGAADLRPDSESIGVTRQALTAAQGEWFRDNRCPHWGTYPYCYPYWGDGGYYRARYFTSSNFVIAPFSGYVVSVKPLWNGKVQAVLPVFVGEDHHYWQRGKLYYDCPFLSPNCRYKYYSGEHRWQIDDAIGDGFHWGGNFHNQYP